MQDPFGNSLSHIVEARSATIKQPRNGFGLAVRTERMRLPAARQVGDPRDDSLINAPKAAEIQVA